MDNWSPETAAYSRATLSGELMLPPVLKRVDPSKTHWRQRCSDALASAARAETLGLQTVYRDLARHYWAMHLLTRRSAATIE